MRKTVLVLTSMALAVSLGLTACTPFWGPGGSGGMMGPQQPGQQPRQGQPSPYGPSGGMGPGMMGSGGMMGPGMMSGMPMAGGMMGYYPAALNALSGDEAKDTADRYLASLNNAALEIGEFEEYSHNFYVSLVEKSTGRGAIEVIIDRYSGSLQPETQSIMWSGKYGMMGRYEQAQMPVTQQQAVKIAQDFLDVVYPGTKADEIVAYYGYYTIMTKLEGKHYGMLSVNGYSGDVWYHTWHGMFISEVQEHS